MDLVETFYGVYVTQIEFFEEISHICAQQCENGLESLGIRSIVTYRAKRPDKAIGKIRKRISEGANYKSTEDIYKDIIDLAGVRIALYFPGDRNEVGKFIEKHFESVRPPKIFPTNSVQPEDIPQKRFSGYWATHYLVKFKKDTLSNKQERYLTQPIEIQIASVLMHSWAEVEHDLVYKPTQGNLSIEEYAILDELNGLVLSGEIALERLQRAIEIRVSHKNRRLSNHYELAAYLVDEMRPILKGLPSEPSLGRVDYLFKLLVKAKMDQPDALKPFIKNVTEATEDSPISEQLVNQIIRTKPELVDFYSKLRAPENQSSAAPVETMGHRISDKEQFEFIKAWAELEQTITQIFKKQGISQIRSDRPLLMQEIQSAGIFDTITLGAIFRFRAIRSSIVHGGSMNSPKEIKKVIGELEDLIDHLKHYFKV
jgi:ppGpp synthetase/RelA/SpoT-type nucleotidyltranferase